MTRLALDARQPPVSGSSPRDSGDLRRFGAATAYGGRVSRKPAFLAALASSAVPGLDPVSVQAALTEPGHYHEVAFVTDSQHRRWVVRAPLTSAAGAQMDTSVALLHLLGRRLPFSVPAPRGFVAVPEGRAVVYPYLSGRPVDFGSLPAGPGLAAEVGRAIAALHNVDRAVFDEAGLPIYDAEEIRTRRLDDLDRAAATGHVPTGLLSRWERALEEVSFWRFAPTPVHGGLTGGRVLVAFEGDDASSGRVRAITGWDNAKVADPAEDLAALVAACRPEAFESVLEGYAHSRVERPDRHLRRRARLASELRLLGALLGAVSAGERDLIKAHAADLRELDEHTVDEPDEEPQPAARVMSAAPVARVAVASPVAPASAAAPIDEVEMPSSPPDAPQGEKSHTTDEHEEHDEHDEHRRQEGHRGHEGSEHEAQERPEHEGPEPEAQEGPEAHEGHEAHGGPENEGQKGPEGHDQHDQHDEPSNAGGSSDPTTVIPEADLEPIRRARTPAAEPTDMEPKEAGSTKPGPTDEATSEGDLQPAKPAPAGQAPADRPDHETLVEPPELYR